VAADDRRLEAQGVKTALAAALAALLVFAAAAHAAPQGAPVRLWSVSKVEQGAGEKPVTFGGQVGDVLQKLVDLGPVTFNFRGTPSFDRAEGDVFSSADGTHYAVGVTAPILNPFRANSAKGGVTHLDEYQAYEKREGDASLRIKISEALVEAIDANARVNESLCPPTVVRCWPLRSIIRFHARAYAASAGGDFYNVGGVAFIKGRHALWDHFVATSADSQAPVWSSENFIFDPDNDDSDTFSDARMTLDRPPTLKVPLASVPTGELFAVHVSLEAEAVDDIGLESAAQAFIRDPQERGPALLTARGLIRRGKPRFKEPRVKALQPAHCATRRRGAGVLSLSDPGFAANESESAPMVLVTRSGGSRGAASVTLSTRGGTARAGGDFKTTRTTVRFANGDTSPRAVEIPLREDAQAEPPETFTVSLAHARCGGLGTRKRATVTIVDDDQGPPPPPPSFTIGGTVDGLTGTGLVLTDRGTDVAVSANGRFAFPATFTDGASYDVQVRTQPHGPDQVCTVDHGAGTVSGADVSDVAVHCDTPATSAALDSTFGSGGRVSTPVGGGHGEAVVIQPDGHIVTAGWRTAGAGNDFALTRHDASGNLDLGFGTSGIRTTDLGGADDEAYDAALTPDGGVVVVGRTDAAGLANIDFGVVRYGPDGTPDGGFGSGGIVKTDILGGGDQANAVAVQPDGKIVVAGFATRSGIDGDFAVVRYNANGTPDQSFGTAGIVTTDLGTRSDDARAIAIQPDGKIVVAGSAGDNGDDIALVRYLSDGHPDMSFGQAGIRITDLGSDDVANGVALTASGQILVAGYTLGPKINRDFLLARYTADGTLDASFGDHGAVKTDVGGGDDFAENLVVDASGRVVVVGRATSATILDMALVRYLPGGGLDTSFDGDGILAADFHGRGEFGQDVAIDAAGRIVAAGYTANGPDTEFALLRANP
jgi:uncharacterized delta-60 repeat protein